MTNPTNPDDLTPFENLLYAYITTTDTSAPNPLTYLDDEPAHWTANNGPRTPDQALHILTTPHLLQLLRELWNDEPPAPTVTATCLATPEGTTLLTATGHTPTGHTTNQSADGLSHDEVDNFLLAIEFHLLTHTLETTTSHGSTGFTTRGVNDLWTATTTLPTGQHITLQIRHHKNSHTGAETLYIQTNDAWTLLETSLTWTLTYTHTHIDGTICTHTATTTAPDPYTPTLTWHTETPHHPTPTNNPTLTLTPQAHE